MNVFNAIYIDTNVLTGTSWPAVSVGLQNLFTSARGMGVSIYVPRPVLVEAEEHWKRRVVKQADSLVQGRKQLIRLAAPVDTKVVISHESIARLLQSYCKIRDATMTENRIQEIPLAGFDLGQMFERATKYVMPFQTDQEGKGFQDAVILSSVIQHLKDHPALIGVLVTKDRDFGRVDLAQFDSGLGQGRLTFQDFETISKFLFSSYWEAHVTQPFNEEAGNAEAAAKKMTEELRQFTQANLTPTLVTAGETDEVQAIESVDSLDIIFVYTPLPIPGISDRDVKIAISVAARCTVRVLTSIRYLSILGMLPGHENEPLIVKQQERSIRTVWYGGIEANAEVKARRYTIKELTRLLTKDEMGSGKYISPDDDLE